MATVVPVIVCGGEGQRLWPLSTPGKPKQFLSLTDERSLLSHAVLRCQGESFDPRPILVGAHDHQQHLTQVLSQAQCEADLVLEHMARDSCAAVIAGAIMAQKRGTDAVVLVLAADHFIPDTAGFQAAVRKAFATASAGGIVIFGIRPTSANTTLGYVLADDRRDPSGVARVRQFIEKPHLDLAKRCLAQGYLWNSGNFLFRADVLLQEASLYAPEVLQAVSRAVERARVMGNITVLSGENLKSAPRISFDHAILEKTSRAHVLPVDFEWHDIGTWDALADTLVRNEHGNSHRGPAVIVDSRNTMTFSDGKLVAVVGCDDLIVAVAGDAVLVTRKGCSGQVKSLADRLNLAAAVPE